MEPFDARLAEAAPRALRAALGWLGDEQEAREAAQESFLKAHRARERYDAERPFYPWLRRIVRNTCFDRLSRRKHREASGLRDEWVASDAPTALDLLSREAAIQSVRNGLERLNEEQREILVLRHFEDLPYNEIAAILDVPIGTVMSRLYRARKALVRVLDVEAE